MKKTITFFKTLLLAAILLVGSGNVWGQGTVNYAMSSMGLANAATVGTTVRNTTDGKITFTFAQNSSTSAPAYYTTGTAVRLYQNAIKGGSIKIMVESGYKITSATVTKASGDGDGPVGYAVDGGTEAGSFADGTTSNTTGAINATSSVEFYSKGTSSSTRFYVVSFSVTYTATSSCTSLAAPTVTATPGSEQVQLSWPAVTHASSYSLIWNGGSAETVTSPVTKTGLTNGTSYSYSVMAVGDGSTYCSTNTAATGNVTPVAPAYTITESSNNESWGTVSRIGTVITGAPVAGYRYASPAYAVTSGTATVSQSGNDFTVTPTSNCAVQINFEAIPTYTVTFDKGTGVCATASLTESVGNAGVTLPTATASTSCAALNWEFAGWATAAQSESTTAPTLLAAGTTYYPTSNVSLYAVYKQTVAGGSVAATTSIAFSTVDNGWTESRTSGDGGDYWKLFLNTEYFLSPTIDLSTITAVSAKIGTFGGGTHTLSVQDESGNVWGTTAVNDGAEVDKVVAKTGSLSGTGKVKFVCTTGATSTGLRVQELSIDYMASSSTTTYNSNPSCSNPSIAVSTTALNAFTYAQGSGPSSEQTFTVSGVNLSNDISIAASTNYEISKSSGTGYTTPLTFAPSTGSVAETTVYVRLKAGLTMGDFNSEVLNITSTGADAKTVTCSGNVTAAPTPEPSAHATGFTATANTSSQITVSWTDATGAQLPENYLVKASTGTPAEPADGTAEVDAALVQNIAYGVGTAVFTGLDASTTYNFSIWPYTNSGATINYKTGSEPTANATTPVQLVTGATVTLRPSHIDISDATSESAVLMTLSNYSSDAAKYRLYASSQYSCWDEANDTYITSSAYSAGPSVPGTPTTSTTFWIVFQRGTNATTGATYRDRLGAEYDSNYQTAVLPDATEISSGFDLSGNFIGTQAYDNSVKHVVLAYSAEALISASSTTLSTGAFVLVCPTGTTIDKIEIRAIDNTLIASSIGSWNSTSSIGNLPTPTFTGTGDWTSTARWNTASVPVSTDNVIIDGDATISTDVEVSALTINASKSLTVNAAKQLTVTGALTNAGTLNLLSTTGGAAATLTAATASGAGTTNASQYLSSSRNWYVASPVTGAALPATGYTLYERNEANVSWPTPTGTFTQGKGYIAYPGVAGTTLTFSGQLNLANVDVALTWAGASSKGFNLIGNPYPSHLTWTKAFTDANDALIESSIYYRTNSGTANNNGLWSTPTYNANSGASVGGATAIIPPMQAVWIRAKATDTLTLDNSMLTRSHQGSNPLKAPAVVESQKLRLVVTDGQASDEMLVYFNANASNTYDRYDSPKMMNGSLSSVPDMYTMVGTEQLVINGMNTIPTEIPLYFKANASTASQFSVSATEFSNFENGTKVYIKNNNTGFEQLISEGATFNFDAASTPSLSVIIKAPGVISGLENNNPVNFNVYANAKGQITVTMASITGNDVVAVYNSVGQRLMSQTLTSTQTVLNDTFATGVYVIKVNEVTHKVIVK